jgi:hypothetical protein
MVLKIKLLLVVASTLASLAALHPAVAAFFQRARWSHLVNGYFLLRILFLAVAIFGFKFAYPAWNAPFYYSEGMRILAGQVPDRDFFTPYSPLFTYFPATAVGLWPSLFSIVLLFQLVEWLAVYLLVGDAGPKLGIPAFLLFALNPVTLVYFWLGAEQTAFVLLALALALHWRTPVANGIGAALGMMISKVLSLWFLIPLLLARGWKMRFTFIGVCLLIALPFVLAGSTVMSSKITNPDGTLQDQSLLGTAGSIWEFFSTTPAVSRAAVMTALALTALFITWRHLSLYGFGANPEQSDVRRFVGLSAVCLILTFQVFFKDIVSDYLCPATWLVPLLLVRNDIRNFDFYLFLAVAAAETACELLMYHNREYAGHAGFLTLLFSFLRVASPLLALSLLVRFLYLLSQFKPSATNREVTA